MVQKRKKEINALRKQIAKLEAIEEREAQIKDTVKKVYKDFKAQASKAGVTLEEVLRAHTREVSRVMDKITGATEAGAAPKRGKKKATRKKARKAKASTIKIPAGNYTNIPPDPKAVFKVSERGPRPKLLKAHAEKLGLEKFLSECKKK